MLDNLPLLVFQKGRKHLHLFIKGYIRTRNLRDWGFLVSIMTVSAAFK